MTLGARSSAGPRVGRVVSGLALVACLALPVSGHAVQPDEILADYALETRARTISGEIRCLVCQNQSIDDSDAPLARDLRVLVRERLEGGDTDAQVRSFIVGRYGEFVLLRPVVAWHTAVLWAGPFLIVGAAMVGFVLSRRRGSQAAQAGLTADEEAQLKAALEQEPV